MSRRRCITGSGLRPEVHSLSLCAMLTPRSHPVFFQSSECDLCFWFISSCGLDQVLPEDADAAFRVFSFADEEAGDSVGWSPAANPFEATNKIARKEI